ncbi:MAG: SDR family oxidoreductase [Nitrospinota bacterium]
MELSGKVALITGAAQGIGEALARRFAAEGGKVAAVDLLEERLASLEAGSGGAILGVRADLSSTPGVERAFDAAVARFGGVDILVNCAVVRAHVALEAVEEPLIDLALAVGVKGLILCARRAAREMRKRGGGVIVNLSSFYAKTPAKDRAVYVAVKGAVEGLTRSLAVEFAEDQIRVNAVAPGPVLTERRRAMGDGQPGQLAERYRKSPMGRFGEVEEVVEAILFLATPRSSFMTGQIMALDGGLTIV